MLNNYNLLLLLSLVIIITIIIIIIMIIIIIIIIVITWTKNELHNMDRATRKMMTMNKVLHPRSDTELTHYPLARR